MADLFTVSASRSSRVGVRGFGAAERGQSVRLLDGAEQRVVVQPLAIDARGEPPRRP